MVSSKVLIAAVVEVGSVAEYLCIMQDLVPHCLGAVGYSHKEARNPQSAEANKITWMKKDDLEAMPSM